jgi:hypothetical protein
VVGILRTESLGFIDGRILTRLEGSTLIGFMIFLVTLEVLDATLPLWAKVGPLDTDLMLALSSFVLLIPFFLNKSMV